MKRVRINPEKRRRIDPAKRIPSCRRCGLRTRELAAHPLYLEGAVCVRCAMALDKLYPVAPVKATDNATERVEKLDHLKRLADAMKPDAREYEYRGEVVDAAGENAKCSCGHPIRYVFLVRRKTDNHAVPIGSVCIETSVPWLIAHGNQALADALSGAVAKLKKEIAEAKRREAEARASELVMGLTAEWAALMDWREEARKAWTRAHGAWMPHQLYVSQAPLRALTTAGRTLSSIRKRYGTVWAMFEAWAKTADVRLPNLPSPAHPEARKGCAAVYASDAKALAYRLDYQRKNPGHYMAELGKNEAEFARVTGMAERFAKP